MSKTWFIIFLTMIYHLRVQAQVVYVDSNTGDDNNPGNKEAPVFSIKKAAEIIKSGDNNIYTMKINPGIYVLDGHVPVSTGKEMTDKRIVIEASILPDDTSWTPEKMPVIANNSKKGKIPGNDNFVVSFLIDESHVTIRGIKFHGYFYPHTRYFPIARFNKTKTDLLVEQCMFVGDANISQIQAGLIAHGNEIKVDHCVFYKVRNTVVFFLDSGDGIKTGNGITNSIIFGASQAVWTVSPDKDFKFENNIVSDCRYVWAKNDFNKTKYSVNNCIIVNNQHYMGIADKVRLSPKEFEIDENNVTVMGEVSLRLTGIDDEPYLDEVDRPLPIDYMHPVSGTPGHDMMAGLFKNRKQ
jgi:hypothetical protein